MNKEQNLNEPQNQQLNIAGVNGSVFIQEKIWDKHSKFVSGELSDLQHCAGTNLMHRVEFNNALDAIIPSVDDAGAGHYAGWNRDSGQYCWLPCGR